MRKFKSEEEFNRAKDEILEKVILHELHPEHFSSPVLKEQEIAILFAPDNEHVMTDQAIQNTQRRALEKLRKILAKDGVKSVDDILDTARLRETASAVRTQNYG